MLQTAMPQDLPNPDAKPVAEFARLIAREQLSCWQAWLSGGESLWIAAPSGYPLPVSLPDEHPCVDLRQSPMQPTLLPTTPTLWLAHPDTPGEGTLRLQGIAVRRLGHGALEWPMDKIEDLPVAYHIWCRRLGRWPLAWQWLEQAITGCANDEDSPTRRLQHWGADLLSSLPLPEVQRAALLLLAPDPQQAQALPFAEELFAAICHLPPDLTHHWITQLVNAGWLLPSATGWQWQPFIAWLCASARTTTTQAWTPLIPTLFTQPLELIVRLLPDPASQPAALMSALLPRIGWHCVEQGKGEWLATALFALPLEPRRQQPGLTLLEAWVELEIAKHSERACAALAELDVSRLSPQERQIHTLMQSITEFHFDQIERALARLETLPPLPAPWQTPQRLTLAICALLNGNPQLAQPTLDDLFARAGSTGQYHLKLMTANRLAQLHYYRGDWYATERVLQQALGFAHELGLLNDPALDSNYRMLADQALLQGKEQEAARWMEQGKPLAEGWGEYWSLPYQTQQLMIQLWRNDSFDLRQQVCALDERRFSQLYCRQWQYRTGLAIAWGYVRLEERNGLLRLKERSAHHEICHTLYDLQDNLLYSILSLLVETPCEENQLEAEAHQAESWQCYWLEWQYRLLLLCQRQESAPEPWHELLQEMSGAHSRPLLPFMLLGVRSVAALQQLCRWPQCSETVLDYARAILTALTSPLAQGEVLSGLEGLSQRQQQILRLIAQGLSNEQIAERLFVAPSTIKTHINHLYAKLGVNNRAEAQAVARQRLG